MTLTQTLSLTLLVASFGMRAAETDSFDLKVTRLRVPSKFRNQPGDLHIDASGVTFRSTDGKTSITIPMGDLRTADVADPRALQFETYTVEKGKPFERRSYTFRARPDFPVTDLSQFLASRVYRPVIGHYDQASRFKIPAYHRHLRSGTNGMLEIGDESIQFVSDKPADSRTWRYRDIETIGMPDKFRFRITTGRETYTLELKSELPDAAYQLAWNNVYNLERNIK